MFDNKKTEKLANEICQEVNGNVTKCNHSLAFNIMAKFKVHFVFQKMKIDLYISSTFSEFQVKNFCLKDVCFVTNTPLPAFGYTKEIKNDYLDKVYSLPVDSFEKNIIKFLSIYENVKDIKSFQLQLKEYFIIATNGMCLRLKLESANSVIEKLKILDRIFNRNTQNKKGDNNLSYFNGDSVKIDLNKIPKPFRHLIDLAKKWAISDDVERELLIRKTSFEEKESFVKKTKPYIVDVKKWLEEHREEIPLPDELVLFEMMVESFYDVEASVYT